MISLLLDLHDRKTLVIGGGKIATRKVLRLFKETQLTVISPDLTPELRQLADEGKINWLARPYQSGDIAPADFIYICSSDGQVNAEIVASVRPDQWLNDTSDKSKSNFYSMAEIQDGDRQIALSSHGKNPSDTRKLKEELKNFLTEKKEV